MAVQIRVLDNALLSQASSGQVRGQATHLVGCYHAFFSCQELLHPLLLTVCPRKG